MAEKRDEEIVQIIWRKPAGFRKKLQQLALDSNKTVQDIITEHVDPVVLQQDLHKAKERGANFSTSENPGNVKLRTLFEMVLPRLSASDRRMLQVVLESIELNQKAQHGHRNPGNYSTAPAAGSAGESLFALQT